MFIFQSKKIPKIIAGALSWIILVAFFITTAYIFLFIYKNIYFAVIQEIAIINLKSELTITKVHKQRFDSLYQKYLEKNNPLITINFANSKNPFKSIESPPLELE